MVEPTGSGGTDKANDSGTPPGTGPSSTQHGGGREGDWALGDLAASPGSEQGDRRRMIPAFLVGALTGVLVLGLLWGATAIFGSDDDTARGATSAVSDTETAGASPSGGTSEGAEESPSADSSQQAANAAPPTPSAMERCRQANAELTGPLSAAVPALDQWEVHVGAMNKLVVGAITLQQATAFWDQTRVGARQNLDRFYSANRRVPFAGVDCPSPEAGASAKLSKCARHVAGEAEALEAARVAMQTWKTHVRHMEMLRMGHMTPAAATRQWLASWRDGVRELQAYRSAKAAVAGAGGC